MEPIARWNKNFRYYSLLVGAMPSPCHFALDVGCGAGTFVRALTERAETVIGIDRSGQMIDQARRAVPDAGVMLIRDDFLTHDFGDLRFDFIACTAALHHMDFHAAMERMKSLLRHGGVIGIVGLARPSTAMDFAFDLTGFLVTRADRLRCKQCDRGAPLASPTMTYSEIEKAAADVLPGSVFRRLVLFRYFLTWRKAG
ncbi:MAG TPA: class I SAM-dependent methyltransferase [Candidatus Elarobacter sp.]|nr:class I SAM-dependent methyltransferase [Candidatus Elarobacter sp.]